MTFKLNFCIEYFGNKYIEYMEFEENEVSNATGIHQQLACQYLERNNLLEKTLWTKIKERIKWL